MSPFLVISSRFNVFVMCAPEAPFLAELNHTGGKKANYILDSNAFAPRGQSPYGEAGVWVKSETPIVVPPVEVMLSSAHCTVDKVVESVLGALVNAKEPLVQSAERAVLEVGGKIQRRRKPKHDYPGSQENELIVTIVVRNKEDQRTDEYTKLLNDLGKPGG